MKKSGFTHFSRYFKTTCFLLPANTFFTFPQPDFPIYPAEDNQSQYCHFNFCVDDFMQLNPEMEQRRQAKWLFDYG